MEPDPVGRVKKYVLGGKANEQRIVHQLPLRVKQERRTARTYQHQNEKENENWYSHDLSGKNLRLIVSDRGISVNGTQPTMPDGKPGTLTNAPAEINLSLIYHTP